MVYVFKRHKKSGKKTIIRKTESVEEARDMCIQLNYGDNTYWYEFTEDIEYTK